MFKKLIILSSLLILTNCASPGVAFLGPSLTVARTGSVYQAGLSYGSSHMIKKTKESIEKIKKTKKTVSRQIDQLNKKIKKNELNKLVSKNKKNQADLFFKAVKDNFKKYN
jgi:hypothetical protein